MTSSRSSAAFCLLIMDPIASMTCAQLRNELRQRGVAASGAKNVLAGKLEVARAMARTSAAIAADDAIIVTDATTVAGPRTRRRAAMAASAAEDGAASAGARPPKRARVQS